MSTTAARLARAQEMFAHIEKYRAVKGRATSLTQKAFCEQEGLPLSTFQNWLKKYRTRQRQVETPATAPHGFIPLRVRELRALPSPSLQCVIEFSHGVTIRLSGPVDFAMLAQLIHSTAV